MLHISLFGHYQATWRGSSYQLPMGTAAQKLLVYLLLHVDDPRPRRSIAFVLWPDETEDVALQHLRRQLHNVLQHLPEATDDESWIQSDRLVVAWNPASAFRLDTRDFAAHLEAAAAADPMAPERVPGPMLRAKSVEQLERAVAIYRGDLLPSLYDDWVLTERERYRLQYLSAAERLVALHAYDGRLAAGALCAERLLTEDALREDAHRWAIGLHYLSGDRAAALRAYRDCRDVLRREIDIEPMPATSGLAEAVRTGSSADRVARLLSADLPLGIDLASNAPAIAAHHVPQPLTTLVGRERETQDVLRLLAEHRLVTLTGSGGCGKSRLAAHVARHLVDARFGASHDADEAAAGPYAGGAAASSPGASPRAGCQPGPTLDAIWWIDMSVIDAPELVPNAVAGAMALKEDEEGPGLDLHALIARSMGNTETLIVVDNAERLVDAVAETVEQLLNHSGSLRILVTSREILSLVGESVYRVPPLSYPSRRPGDARDRGRPGESATFDAVRLFKERSSLVSHTLPDTSDREAVIASICQHLEGNPLAIELAAAQTATVPLATIRERVGERMRLLTMSTRSVQPHHRSVAAAIGWSYESLSPLEATLLRRLSVFRGGWTEAQAAAVCEDDDLASDAVPRLLAALLAKSLIQDLHPVEGARRRSRMLETVRQFATELLVETGDHVRYRDRHARFFADLAEEAEPKLVTEDAPAWMARIGAELPNMRSALRWGLRPQGDTDAAVRLALALARYWSVRGTPTEGLRWLEALASRHGSSLDERTAAWLTYHCGSLAARQGDPERAESCAAACLPVFRAHDDKIGVAWALNDLGLAAFKRADYALAVERFEESIAVKRELGHDWDVARTLCNVGQLAWRCGDFVKAEACYRESLAVAARAEGDVPHDLLAANKNNLAELDRCRGDYASAEPLYLEALAAWWAVGSRSELALAMSGLGGTAAGLDHPRRAARLLGAADAERKALGVALDDVNQAEHERMCAHARSLLTPEDWEAAYEQGRIMRLDEAVAYALEGCEGSAP